MSLKFIMWFCGSLEVHPVLAPGVSSTRTPPSSTGGATPASTGKIFTAVSPRRPLDTAAWAASTSPWWCCRLSAAEIATPTYSPDKSYILYILYVVKSKSKWNSQNIWFRTFFIKKLYWRWQHCFAGQRIWPKMLTMSRFQGKHKEEKWQHKIIT
jgi:hypothetical protein